MGKSTRFRGNVGRFVISMLLLTLMIAIGNTNQVEAATKSAKKISITGNSLDMVAGTSEVIKAKVSPSKLEPNVRFTSDNKSVAKINSKTGKITAIKAGKTNITAKCGKKTTSYELVVHKKGTVIVSTQKELKSALKKYKSKSKTIVVSSNKSTTFKVTKGKYKKVKFEINAPKADVMNYGVFKSVTVNQVKASTYHEYAVGNVLIVYDADCSVDLNGAPAAVNVLSGGKVNISVKEGVTNFKVILKNSADVVLTGSSTSKIEVEIAVGTASLSTNIPTTVNITAKEGAPRISLLEGAEGTTINANSRDQIQNVDNRTTDSISYTVNNQTVEEKKTDNPVTKEEAQAQTKEDQQTQETKQDEKQEEKQEEPASKYPKMYPSSENADLWIDYKSGSIQRGSYIDELVVGLTSTYQINYASGSYYYNSYSYSVEVIHADGTKDTINSYDNIKYTGTGGKSANVKAIGVGSKFNSEETQAGIRVKLYDYNTSTYHYSNMIVVDLQDFYGSTEVQLTNTTIENSINLTGIQSGVEYQTVNYKVRVSHLTESEAYGSSMVTPTFEWCDKDGKTVDAPGRYVVTNSYYACNAENTDETFYYRIYNIAVTNTEGLESGNYYLRFKAKGITSNLGKYIVNDPSDDIALDLVKTGGSIVKGSYVDESTYEISSAAKINSTYSGSDEITYSSLYSSYIEIIHANGSKDSVYCSSSSSDGYNYVETNCLYEANGLKTAILTLSAAGHSYNSDETTAKIRVRIYDSKYNRYNYSNIVEVELAPASDKTDIKYRSKQIDTYSNIEGIQAGIVGQTATYSFTVSHLTYEEVHGGYYDENVGYYVSGERLTPEVVWCTADGADLDKPEGVAVQANNYSYSACKEGDSNYYSINYNVKIINKKALDTGDYYFYLKAKDGQSKVVSYKVIERNTDNELILTKKSGEVHVGSYIDEAVFNLKSSESINGLIYLDCLKSDNTNINYTYVDTNYSDSKNRIFTLSNIGSYYSNYYSEEDNKAYVRVRIYNTSAKTIYYSNIVEIELKPYIDSTKVVFSNKTIEGNSSVKGVQASVINQSAKYTFNVTHLTYEDIYGYDYYSEVETEESKKNKISTEIVWCDENGDEVDAPGEFNITNVNDIDYYDRRYECSVSDSGKNINYYTGSYYSKVVNTSTLTKGTYYLKMKVTKADGTVAESAPVEYVVIDTNSTSGNTESESGGTIAPTKTMALTVEAVDQPAGDLTEDKLVVKISSNMAINNKYSYNGEYSYSPKYSGFCLQVKDTTSDNGNTYFRDIYSSYSDVKPIDEYTSKVTYTGIRSYFSSEATEGTFRISLSYYLNSENETSYSNEFVAKIMKYTGEKKVTVEKIENKKEYKWVNGSRNNLYFYSNDDFESGKVNQIVYYKVTLTGQDTSWSSNSSEEAFTVQIKNKDNEDDKEKFVCTSYFYTRSPETNNSNAKYKHVYYLAVSNKAELTAGDIYTLNVVDNSDIENPISSEDITIKVVDTANSSQTLTIEKTAGSIKASSRVDSITVNATSNKAINNKYSNYYDNEYGYYYSPKSYYYVLDIIKENRIVTTVSANSISGIDKTTSEITFKGVGQYCTNAGEYKLRVRYYNIDEEKCIYSNLLDETVGEYSVDHKITVSEKSTNSSNTYGSLIAGVPSQKKTYNVEISGLDVTYTYSTNNAYKMDGIDLEWYTKSGDDYEQLDNSDGKIFYELIYYYFECERENSNSSEATYTVKYTLNVYNKAELEAGSYCFRVRYNDEVYSDYQEIKVAKSLTNKTISAAFESGNVRVGSNEGQCKVKVTSNGYLNKANSNSEAYSPVYTYYYLQVIYEDGTFADVCNASNYTYSNDSANIVCIDEKTSEVTFSGFGKYLYSTDTKARLRVCIYDNRYGTYIYSNIFEQEVEAYQPNAKVKVSTSSKDGVVFNKDIASQRRDIEIYASGDDSKFDYNSDIELIICNPDGTEDLDSASKFSFEENGYSIYTTYDTKDNVGRIIEFFGSIKNVEVLEREYYYYKISVNGVESEVNLITVK